MGEKYNNTYVPGDLDEIRDADHIAPGDGEWLKLVRDSYQSSTDYLDDGIRTEMERAMARFQSTHPAGSKYHTAAYKRRSKIFRPKTRSAARRAEATAAKALFSNSDLIDVRGQNKGSAAQAASARVNKELLQYRLEHTLDWFVTAMGARQDTFNMGICVSLQTWAYEVEQDVEYAPAVDTFGQPMIDEMGNELGEEIVTERVVRDEPVLDLIPVENLRFDANADWRDPVHDSPFLTLMIPMYIGDVLQRMTKPNPVTQQPEWREYTMAELLAANEDKEESKSVRQAREGRSRIDPMANQTIYNEFTKVWVHLNIIRKEGKDYAFYTLGTRLMLSEPVPVRELLPLGRSSIVVGFSIVEAHKNYPIGGNTLAAPLQSEINDVANQRMDNVKLALNKRFILRRGANVDQTALLRSVPGGGIMAGDPDKDVRIMDYPDVTGSSYQEQDRLAQEQDELVGTFSGSSVQANRQLNETVGGMNMLQGDAMNVAEYELRTWIETWVEPVLRNLQKLEAMFETDETILSIAGENSEVFEQYGRDVAIDNLLDHELVVSVNVGMGNTDPMQRVQKFQMVLGAAAQIPEVAQRMKGEEIGKEMFALGGYSEGERFFMTEEEFAQRQKAAAEQAQQPDNSMAVAEMKAATDKELEAIRSEDRRYAADRRAETEREKMASAGNIKLKDLYERIGLEEKKRQDNRDITALKEGNKSRELRIKQAMGSGI